MAYIDFEIGWPATNLSDEGGRLNTLVDSGEGVQFIIASGAMQVRPVADGRALVCTRRAAPGAERDSMVLVVRFAQAYRHVALDVAEDDPFAMPVWIDFYADYGLGGLVERRTLAGSRGNYVRIEYYDPERPIRELTIRSRSAVNRLDNLVFDNAPRSVSRRSLAPVAMDGLHAPVGEKGTLRTELAAPTMIGLQSVAC